MPVERSLRKHDRVPVPPSLPSQGVPVTPSMAKRSRYPVPTQPQPPSYDEDNGLAARMKPKREARKPGLTRGIGNDFQIPMGFQSVTEHPGYEEGRVVHRRYRGIGNGSARGNANDGSSRNKIRVAVAGRSR